MAEDEKKQSLEELIGSLSVSMNANFAKTNANIALVSDDLSLLKGRVASVEGRQSDIDTWRAGNSVRVRSLASDASNADLAQQAKLAEEIVARKSLAEKVDSLDTKVDTLDDKQNTQLAILSQLQKLAANPIVKQVATAVGTAILSYLAMKGLK